MGVSTISKPGHLLQMIARPSAKRKHASVEPNLDLTCSPPGKRKSRMYPQKAQRRKEMRLKISVCHKTSTTVWVLFSNHVMGVSTISKPGHLLQMIARPSAKRKHASVEPNLDLTCSPPGKRKSRMYPQKAQRRKEMRLKISVCHKTSTTVICWLGLGIFQNARRTVGNKATRMIGKKFLENQQLAQNSPDLLTCLMHCKVAATPSMAYGANRH